MDQTAVPARHPTLIVVRGAPGDVDLAAVTAVLMALAEGRAAATGSAAAVARTAGKVGWTVTNDYRTPSAWTSR